MAGEAARLLTFLLLPLASWLDDPATEEICINRPGELFVRQRGQFRAEDRAARLCRPRGYRHAGRGAA